MNIKNLSLEFIFTRLLSPVNIIKAIFEEIENQITITKVIIVTVIPWILIVLAQIFFDDVINILNNLPLLIDQKDFCFLVSVAFLSIGILISYIRECYNCLVRFNFYLFLIFIMLSKLALY